MYQVEKKRDGVGDETVDGELTVNRVEMGAWARA